MASNLTTVWFRQAARRVALLLVVLWAGVMPAAEKPPALTEPQIKALFLFNFVRYVEWPATAFAATNAPIVIGLVGQASLADDLQKITEGKTVNGRRVVVRRADDEQSRRECHVLFLPTDEKRRWPEIQRGLANAPVLTVSDTERFLEQGGAVNLVKRDNKIRLEICQPVATQAGLKISSKLLGVADRVVRETQEER